MRGSGVFYADLMSLVGVFLVRVCALELDTLDVMHYSLLFFPLHLFLRCRTEWSVICLLFPRCLSTTKRKTPPSVSRRAVHFPVRP